MEGLGSQVVHTDGVKYSLPGHLQLQLLRSQVDYARKDLRLHSSGLYVWDSNSA